MERSERIEPVGVDGSKIQSELFEDAFLKNLKGLQGKIKQQHIDNSPASEIQYIGDSTRKLVELKLLELESIISARKKEQEWIHKREIRKAQCDRMEQARMNLSMLMQLENQGKKGNEDQIEDCLKIMQEVEHVGGEDVIPHAEMDTLDKVKDSFHVTEKDLRRAFGKTNILDVMRNAKKNGWTMKISEDEVAVYRHGKRIDGREMKEFVSADDRKHLNKQSRELKSLLLKRSPKKEVKKIKRR